MAKAKNTTKKPKKAELIDEEYDILLDDESFGNNTVTIIATIILTMATISGVGYWFHLDKMDENTQYLEERIIGLESRLTSEIRDDNVGSREIGILQDKIKNTQEQVRELIAEKEELQNKLTISEQELNVLKSGEQGQVAELNTKISGYEQQIQNLNLQITDLQKKTEGIY